LVRKAKILMFVINVPESPYHDPWNSSLDDRLKALETGDLRIAYYYDFPDSSTFRYRVYNMMQVLSSSARKISSTFLSFNEQDYLNEAFDRADVIVVVRARYNHNLNRALTRARNKGKRIFFDIDDLVFNPAYTHLILDTLDQDMNNPNLWDFWFGYIGRINATLSLCDQIITTNDFLAGKLAEYSGKPVSVIPNFLNKEQLDISNQLYQQKISQKFQRNTNIHLGYFSGTPSHSRDFEIISDAVCNVMESDPRIMLRMVGYIDLRPPLDRFSSRIEFIKLTNFVNLQRLISEVEINLVPLQDNIFTNCKSELKYFEAGIVGTVTIATPTFTYANAIQDGQNGFLSRSFEWQSKISQLISQIDNYPELARTAYEHSEKTFAWNNQVALLERILCP
jgi:glycosyltransferase involved in cell wall biosynthesis